MAHLKKRMKEKNNLSYGALIGSVSIALEQKSATEPFNLVVTIETVCQKFSGEQSQVNVFLWYLDSNVSIWLHNEQDICGKKSVVIIFNRFILEE